MTETTTAQIAQQSNNARYLKIIGNVRHELNPALNPLNPIYDLPIDDFNKLINEI